MGNTPKKSKKENTNRKKLLNIQSDHAISSVQPVIQTILQQRSVFGNVIVNINNDMSNSVLNLMVHESKKLSSDSNIIKDNKIEDNKNKYVGSDNGLKSSLTKSPKRRSNTSISTTISENENIFNLPIFILKCEDDFISNKVEVYNSVEKNWESFADIDSPSISPTFVMMKDYLCIVGGLENGKDFLTRVMHINIKTKETEIFNLQMARAAAAAVFAKGTLYITGGLTTTGPIETVERWIFLLNSWEMISSMKEKRWFHASVEFDSKIFVSGGENESFGVMNTCEIYDPDQNSWKQMKPMLSCRSKHQLLVLNNEIYALGGYYGEVLTSVEKYRPNEDCWFLLADLPIPICGQKAIVYQNKIICFCEDYAYEYNSNANEWKRFLSLDNIDRFWDILIE